MSFSQLAGPVALFAPQVSQSAGGVWQFYQWVAKQVEPAQRLLLVAPSLLLKEIRCESGEIASHIDFEEFRSSVEASTVYQALEKQKYRRIRGVRLPFYRTAAPYIKRRFFDDDVFEHMLRRRLQRDGVEVMHIPMQQISIRSVVARFPYVINPHDFQHEHFPEFFSTEILEHRRSVWYTDQRNASAVVVHSRQTRRDAIKYLGIPEERVFYAPYGPLDTFPEPDDSGLLQARREFALPNRFIFYPARSWPHKNHLALLDAIRLLKKRGVLVNAVFTTIVDNHGLAIRERIEALGIGEQVTIVGRASPQSMGALYRLCTMVVVPSLFEQNSGPMLEAIHFGKPVAVSHLEELVTTLDGAGELFDPRSVTEIANTIDRLWSSEGALSEAKVKIKQRRARMSWEPFREIYCQAYNHAMT